MNYKILTRHTSTVLTLLGISGVAITGILAAKGSISAMRKIQKKEQLKKKPLDGLEKIKISAPEYFPAITTGVATVLCITGAHLISKRQQASITSAYTLLNNYHKQYRKTLIDLKGEEVDKEVRATMARSNCSFHQIGIGEPDKKVWFYEPISERELYCYEREIMDAEYHFNRNFVMRGCANLNEFYEFLGLSQTKEGEELGWTCSDGYMWVDIEHELVPGKYGNPDIYILNYIFPPDIDYLEH